MPLAPVDEPITFAGRSQQQQRQQVDNQDKTQAAPGADNPIECRGWLKNQQQGLNHGAGVLAGQSKLTTKYPPGSRGSLKPAKLVMHSLTARGHVAFGVGGSKFGSI